MTAARETFPSIRSIGGIFLGALALLFSISVILPAPDASASQRRKKGKEERQKKEDAEGEELEQGATQPLLTISGMLNTLPGGQTEIQVRGTASMPDDLELQLSLHLGSHTNEALQHRTHVPVKNLAFGIAEPVTFGPYDPQQMAAGWYWAVVRFRYDDQTNAAAKAAFQKLFSKPDEWKRYVDFSEQTEIRIGTPTQEAREDRERHKHYSESTETLIEILEEFDDALVSALRVGFPSTNEWESYVKDKGLLALEEDDLKRRLTELADLDRFIKGKKLNAGEWRDFLDRDAGKEIETHPLKTGGLRGRILRVWSDHKKFRKSKLTGKIPMAGGRLDRLCSALYKLTMRWSRVLYRKNGLELDPKDIRPVDPIPLTGKGGHRSIRGLAATIDKEVSFILRK